MRTRLLAVALILVVAIPLVILAVGGSGSEGEDGAAVPNAGVRLEMVSGQLVVYVEPARNTRATAQGRRTVPLECFDGDGILVLRSPQLWPFTDTDNGTMDPHVHLAVEPSQARNIEQCSVEGAEPPLAGGF
jgi:hypothetical protein